MADLAEMVGLVTDILGSGAVVVNNQQLQEEMDNTFALPRDIAAIFYPSSTAEVLEIVRLAAQYHVGLYPVSRGMNIGYGDKMPVGQGQILVNLERMRQIREVNEELGYAIIEPGVTQQQLFDFIESHELPFWMDVTGAGVEASIIGNTLEGGFGHTRFGNHRAEISGLEVVLGTGELLETGDFPALGPDLSGIFVQSNFGIVTAMKVKLLSVPEYYESFVVKIDRDELLEPLVAQINKLRAQHVLTSLVHIANATRALVTTQTFPEGFGADRVDCDQAVELMNRGALLKIGYWSAVGSLSGSRRMVAAQRQQVQRSFKKIGSVKFFTDSKIRSLGKVLDLPLLARFKSVASLRDSIKSLKYIHDLGKGIPSNKALDNITWRVQDRKDLGLIWLSPVVSSSPAQVRRMMEIVTAEFADTAFEMPVTLTSVTEDKMVAIFSIIFDKNKKEDVAKAHSLYFSAIAKLQKNGIFMYRSSILGMKDVDYPHVGKKSVFRELKNVLDPKGVIAPGRYIS